MAISRTRFRGGAYFKLRWLLVAIALLCVALGSVGTQLNWIHRRREALRWIHPLRARQLAAQRGQQLPPVKGMYVSRRQVPAPWNLAMFGETGVERIELGRQWVDAGGGYTVVDLQALFPEADVGVAGLPP